MSHRPRRSTLATALLVMAGTLAVILLLIVILSPLVGGPVVLHYLFRAGA